MGKKEPHKTIRFKLLLTATIVLLLLQSYILFQKTKALNYTHLAIVTLLFFVVLMLLPSRKKDEPWPTDHWCGWRYRHGWLVKQGAWMKAHKGIRIRAKVRVKKKHHTRRNTRFLIGR